VKVKAVTKQKTPQAPVGFSMETKTRAYSILSSAFTSLTCRHWWRFINFESLTNRFQLGKDDIYLGRNFFHSETAVHFSIVHKEIVLLREFKKV
jgi:hypothetical protein